MRMSIKNAEKEECYACGKLVPLSEFDKYGRCKECQENFPVELLKLKEKINQRRKQILIHSFLYYHLNENIVDDITWSRWAKELYNLQNEFPEIAKKCVYADDFKDFDYSTGADLPYMYPEIQMTARFLLKHRND